MFTRKELLKMLAGFAFLLFWDCANPVGPKTEPSQNNNTSSTNTSVTKGWQFVGNASITQDDVKYTSISFNGATPCIAFQEWSSDISGYRATMMRFNGSEWEAVGNRRFSAGAANYTCSVTSGGVPYVGFADGANSNRLTVMRHNGTTWELVGTAGFSASWIFDLSMGVDNGFVYVAYSDQGYGLNAVVQKFNGSSWEIVGHPRIGSNVSTTRLSLAFSGGTPYVGFIGSYRASVVRLQGTNWVYVGATYISPGQADYTTLAFDGSTPYLGYRDANNGYRATVVRFNGSSWEVVGSSGFSAGQAAWLSLALIGGVPHLAHYDSSTANTKLMKYNGTGWEIVGGTGFATGEYISLTFSGNVPFIVQRNWYAYNRASVTKYIE